MSYQQFTLDELRERFVPLLVYSKGTNNNLPPGQRVIYWVEGDGVQTLVYLNTGVLHLLPNKCFSFTSVAESDSSRVVKGRIKYTRDGTEYDLGPITKEGRLPSDTSVDKARALLKEGADELEIDLDDIDFKEFGGDF